MRWLWLGAVIWILLPAARAQDAAGDPRAAEAQYRIARRLAAERSPQAEAALLRVVELDPRGPLADDALLDLARLAAEVAWPEQLGQVSADGARRALEILERLRREHPRADRVPEARFMEALLRLAPWPTRDVEAARVALLETATLYPETPWADRARYALAWVAEQAGRPERARNAYTRVLLDARDDAAARRAAAGLGRALWRLGDASGAAAWASRAAEGGLPEARALRELAVRRILAQAGRAPWKAEAERVWASTLRRADALAAVPDGWIVGASREGRVVEFGRDGTQRAQWEVEGLVGLAVGPLGRRFAASEDALFLLVPGAPPVRLRSWPEAWQSPRAIAAGADGYVWIADRRGERVGGLSAAGAPDVQVEMEDSRIVALAWDGATLVMLDARQGRLWRWRPGEEPRVLSAVAGRPIGLAGSPLGLIAWGERQGGVERARFRDGAGSWPRSLQRAGTARAAALAVAPDGAVAWLLEDGRVEVLP